MINKIKLICCCTLALCCTFLNAQDWEEVNAPPSSFRTDHSFGFSLDGLGYLVTGGSETGPRDDFYQFDPATEEWTQLDDFPGPARGYAIGDVYDGKAYLGFGSSPDDFLDDLWVYDNSSEEWTQLADCACQGRNHPAFVAHQGKIFMGMGNNWNGNLNDWWMYDIQTNTWEERADFPSLPRHHPYMFAIGDYVYAGFGHGDDFISDEWYQYDPATDEWTQVASIPGEGRVAGTQFSFNGKGYVLSGDNEDHSSFDTGEFWVYYANYDFWEELESHPSTSRWSPASFIIEGEVYLINGMTLVGEDWVYVDEVYKYPLVADTPPTQITEVEASLDLNISPNPFQEVLHISTGQPIETPLAIKVYDLNGRLVHQQQLSSDQLSLAFLPKGAYQVEIQQNDQIARQLITKQ